MTVKAQYKTSLILQKNFITVDIGGRANEGTAAAIFTKKDKAPTFTKTFYSSVEVWEYRVNHICLIFDQFLTELNLQCMIFLEQPEFWDTHKGMTAARSDSLFKLIFLYGRLYEICVRHKCNPVGLPAKEWKGQLSKDQVAFRIKKKLNMEFKGDVADAVGMGLYMKDLI